MCYDTNFCVACLDKVKHSSLEERRCKPDHSWFRAWQIQLDTDDVKSDSRSGLPRLTGEWLDALRDEWLKE